MFEEERINIVNGRLTERNIISPKTTTQIKSLSALQAQERSECESQQLAKPLGNHNKSQNQRYTLQGGGGSQQRSSSAGHSCNFLNKALASRNTTQNVNNNNTNNEDDLPYIVVVGDSS